MEDAWKVIREMSVRGAPLIAIVASFGLAVECFTRTGGLLLCMFIIVVGSLGGVIMVCFSFPSSLSFPLFTPPPDSLEEEIAWLKKSTTYLRTSRPTAVNLFNAMDMIDAFTANSAQELRDKVREGGEERGRGRKRVL